MPLKVSWKLGDAHHTVFERFDFAVGDFENLLFGLQSTKFSISKQVSLTPDFCLICRQIPPYLLAEPRAVFPIAPEDAVTTTIQRAGAGKAGQASPPPKTPDLLAYLSFCLVICWKQRETTPIHFHTMVNWQQKIPIHQISPNGGIVRYRN